MLAGGQFKAITILSMYQKLTAQVGMMGWYKYACLIATRWLLGESPGFMFQLNRIQFHLLVYNNMEARICFEIIEKESRRLIKSWQRKLLGEVIIPSFQNSVSGCNV